MAEGLIDTREVANNIADLSGIIKNKAYRGSVRGNISNITTNNLVVGTHGNIVEALNLVSQSAHGRMSKEDKKKLDSIEAGSNKYIHPATHPASMIVETTVKRFVTDAQIAAWNAKANRAGDKFTGNVIISTANPTMLNLYRTGNNLNNSIKFSLKDGKINKYIGLYEQEFRIGDSEDLSNGGRIWHSRNSYVVPTPETANNAKFLRNDNTWQLVTPGNIGAYTKAETYNRTEIDNKFNRMNSGMDWKESVATYNDLATKYPNPEDGWTVNVKDTDYTYRWSGSAWIVISANAIPLASRTVDGKMSKADKAKLDSITAGANAYVHPTTHPATMIVEDSTHKFVTQTLIDTWNLRITPVKEAANNARFLRNDNTWQAVTPGNIGAMPIGGGTFTGKIATIAHQYFINSSYGLNMNNSDIIGLNTLVFRDFSDGAGEGLLFPKTSSVAVDSPNINDYDSIKAANGVMYFNTNTVYHSGNCKVIPTPETANNAKFLRNDNTWQLVTPGNIGAYTKAEVDAGWTAGTRDNWYMRNTLSVTGDVNALFKYGKTGFFCGSGLPNQMPWGTHSWKHYITMSHANSAGYTGMIGMNFDGDEIGFKAISGGADKGWRRIWHHGNFNPDARGTVTKTLSITAKSWTDTGIKLDTGTYIIQVYVNDYSNGGAQYTEHYSGIMSSFSTGTNSTAITEIPLTNAGHAPNNQFICLGFKRVGGNTGAQCLVITGTTTVTNASYIFKYRKII